MFGLGTMRGATLAAAMGAGLLLGAVGSAAAEEHSFFVFAEGPEPVTASQGMSFRQFDPALGTITGVTITYTPEEGSFYVRAGVSLTGGEAGIDSATAVTSASLALYFFPSLEPVGPRSMPSPSMAAPLMSGVTQEAMAACTTDGIDCFDSASSFFLKSMIDPNPVLITDQGDLDQFIGTGTVDIVAELVPFFSSSAIAPNGATPESSHLASWSGRVAVTYSYTSVATPEPASLALLGAGMGLLGLLRRRR